MSAELQGLDLKVYLREAGDTDWKEFVCDIDKQLELTNDTTEVETGCGTFVGVKPLKANASGNAVYDIEVGGAAVSWQDAADWQLNLTPLEMLIRNQAFTSSTGNSVAQGAVVHVFMAGKMVGTTLTGPVGEVVKFSWTFKPIGLPDLSGASS